MAHSVIPIPVNNPFSAYEGYNCFGCSQQNPIGLHMHFRLEGEAVVCDWQPDTLMQGWFNILHGGIQATLMDEIASWYVFVKLRTAGVTSRMDVKLSKPVRTDDGPIRLRATLKEMQRNIAIIQVALYLQDGTQAAESLMHYFTYPEKVAREKLFYPGIERFLPGALNGEQA